MDFDPGTRQPTEWDEEEPSKGTIRLEKDERAVLNDAITNPLLDVSVAEGVQPPLVDQTHDIVNAILKQRSIFDRLFNRPGTIKSATAEDLDGLANLIWLNMGRIAYDQARLAGGLAAELWAAARVLEGDKPMTAPPLASNTRAPKDLSNIDNYNAY